MDGCRHKSHLAASDGAAAALLHILSWLALTLCGAMACATVWGQQSAAPTDTAADGQHAAHEQGSDSAAIKRSVTFLNVPPIEMVRADGRRVSLDKELGDGRPVVMNFIYTSCTTICPLGSQELGRLQQQLGSEAGSVHLVSISIDPEQDTPARLRAYSKHFNAGSSWHYYTGTSAASALVQQVFGVYRGDKMSHVPTTLVYRGSGNSWVKLDGFATAEELHQELSSMQALPQVSRR
jgi:protein SCO1